MASTAVCITGLQRTLLTRPVVNSFRQHVAAPLQQPDTFVSLSLPTPPTNSSDDCSPTTMRLITIVYGARVVCIADPPPRPPGDVQNLRQWHAISRCFDEVELHETRRHRRYTWLYRIRTDLVFFGPIFTPPPHETTYSNAASTEDGVPSAASPLSDAAAHTVPALLH
jgi:hypothetical protein